jgi:hypothetical protein
VSSSPKRVGRAIRRSGATLWLDKLCVDGEYDLRKGDVLAASHMNDGAPPLRNGRLVVAAVYRDGRIDVADPFAIVALVVDSTYGDWLYVVDEPTVESRIEDLARRIYVLGTAPDALPLGQAFALAGSWRVYFNRHGAADRPWCVAPDAGGWEVAVTSVGISTVAETVYRPKATPDDEDGRPSAWIAVDGQLTVLVSGHASIGAP